VVQPPCLHNKDLRFIVYKGFPQGRPFFVIGKAAGAKQSPCTVLNKVCDCKPGAQRRRKNKELIQTINKTPCHFVILIMTKPANSSDKPSPADTPTDRPNDNGGKAILHDEDLTYQANEPEQEDIAGMHERDEQPAEPIKTPPTKGV
jgi:hypothetical protein